MTSRLARGKDWAIRSWWRVPPARRQAASRAVRYLGQGINALAITGEVLIMLPVAVIALAIINAVAGAGSGVLLVAMSWVTVSRPSVRATVWLVGGLYLAANLLVLGNEVARVGGVLDAWQTALAWLLTALALAVVGGVFVLPLAQLARTHAPSLSVVIVGWLSATLKGTLAGATTGSLVWSLLPTTGPLSEDQSSGLSLIPLVATALGILCAWCARLWDHERNPVALSAVVVDR